MKFSYDHDLHIHSIISSCSKDPEQTPENILKYAKENNLKTICLTDHFWDENVDGASHWYEPQNFEHISASKPLPQSDGIRFLFGCETELDRDLTLAISPERFDDFDFIVIPTTHFHMAIALFDEQRETAETHGKAVIYKFDAVLNMDLPFHKIGIAHITCKVVGSNKFTRKEVFDTIPDSELRRVFTKAANLGVGIELNSDDINFVDEDEIESILRVFRTAKECGCKFYFGSDSHKPDDFKAVRERFKNIVRLLDLKESDKYDFSKL